MNQSKHDLVNEVNRLKMIVDFYYGEDSPFSKEELIDDGRESLEKIMKIWKEIEKQNQDLLSV